MSNFQNLSPIEIASKRLLSLEEKLAAQGAEFGLKIKRSTPAIAGHLTSLSMQALGNLEFSLTTLARTLEVCATEDISPWDDQEFFKISMRELGLSYPRDFLEKVAQGDIIEGYDLMRRQVYRNMRFMECSSYSLLEVLSYEWPTLFERSNQITEIIMKHCEDIVYSANSTVPAKVPKHFIRELRSSEPQVCEITFRCFAPLFSGPNQPYGFISVCYGQVVQRLDVGLDNVSFV